MNDKAASQNSPYTGYIQELLSCLSDPVHKRLIQAYQIDDPVKSMESELRKVLIEVLQNED